MCSHRENTGATSKWVVSIRLPEPGWVVSEAITRVSTGTGLLKVEEARALLAECRDVDEAKDIRDKARAMEMYFRRREAGREAQNDAAEIKVRAERRLGELLREQKENGTRHPGGKPRIESRSVTQSEGEAPPTLADLGIEKMSAKRWQDVARVPEPVFEEYIAQQRERPDGEITTVGISRLLTVSGMADYDGDEWYTPPDVIALVRKVLGTIDLDPASNEHAQKTVKAKNYFTKADNALEQKWEGKVFCNPPYSMPLIEQFTKKLTASYDSKNVTDAIYLVNNCTDAAWCQSLLEDFPACFTAGRISFLDRSGQKFATRQGQAIFYLGPKPATFSVVFSELGTVLGRLK